jgi:hypothetical protein
MPTANGCAVPVAHLEAKNPIHQTTSSLMNMMIIRMVRSLQDKYANF